MRVVSFVSVRKSRGPSTEPWGPLPCTFTLLDAAACTIVPLHAAPAGACGAGTAPPPAHASSDVGRKCGGAGAGSAGSGKLPPLVPPSCAPRIMTTPDMTAPGTAAPARPLKNACVCVQCTSRQGTHESLALMIASCGAAWQDYKVQAQCFRGTTIPDAFMGVPYTNPFTNRTYVNAYCAICNGEDPTRLDPWLFSLVCEDARRPLYRPDHYDGVYFDSVDHHIVYFSDGTWNAISPDVAVSASLPCHTAIAEPIRVVHAGHGTPRPPHHSTPPLCFSRSASSGGATVSTQGAAINTQGPAAPYCAVRHSCAVPWLSDRGCRCDASCREYGDCCRDSHHYDEAQQMKNFASHTCVAGPTPAYAKTKCSEDWGDEEVLALCLKGNKTPGGSGSLFPVTSTTTAHTYIDHHCAICSGEDLAHLRVWLCLS
ncbi:hypothetical protein O3P69_009704 [Scylla paramamosain]|uniref:SMB domain-containing protein n=1 Tax=Scylla paramamosain TaxID=85552 RepID=A0AAW0SEX3_SCYPA